MNDLWKIAVEEAERRVERSREGKVCEAWAFDFSTNSTQSSGNTAFQRRGTTAQERSYSLPADLASLIQANYQYSPITSAMQGAEGQFLLSLLSRDNTAVPGQSLLSSIESIDPTSFIGSTSLSNIVNRNPYAANYEQSTADLYNRSFGQARAAAMSGPGNVRGGQARTGMELADLGTNQSLNRFREIRGQQDKEAGIVEDAVKLSQMIESMRRGSQLQAQQQQQQGELGRTGQGLESSGAIARQRMQNTSNLQMAGEFLGKPRQTTAEDISGEGQQIQQSSGSGWGAGITCCFIFLEALNGELPPYVRQGRDDFYTPNRRAGYMVMASFTIPLMRRFWIARLLVNLCLVKPFLVVGRWWYHNEHRFFGPVLKPFCWGWFWTWSFVGKMKGMLWHR